MLIWQGDGGDYQEASASAPAPAPAPAQVAATGDPDTDKKIRSVTKKLQAIDKLKQQQAAGKQLEKNQVWMVTSYSQLCLFENTTVVLVIM